MRAQHQSSLGLVHPLLQHKYSESCIQRKFSGYHNLMKVYTKNDHMETLSRVSLFSQSHNHTLTEVIKILFVTLRASKRNITRKLDATLASCDLYTS